MALVTHRTKHVAVERVRREPWRGNGTILDMLDERTRATDRVALRARDEHGSWLPTTWAEYGRAISEAAAGLAALGIGRGDRVAILSWNRPEWQEADLGIISIGAISVPVYPTSSGPQVGYVLRHSGTKLCFVEDSEQLARVLEQHGGLPELEHVVVFDACTAPGDDFLVSFGDLRALGARHLAGDPGLVRRAGQAVEPGDVATIVYTSGTTGPPKGAVITHANVMATLRSVTQIVPLSAHDRFLSFLPLSHITERSVSHFGLIASGGETWFARSISTVAEDLPDCRPTIFFAVPRVWEKFRAGIEERVAALPGVRGRLARMYISLAFRRAHELETGRRMALPMSMTWRALDATVGRQLRSHLGLDRARLTVSGAAPIHPDLVRWFNGIGIKLAEGYGQTEVALATALNPPGAARVGTVGPPLPGVHVRVAADGEVLVQGDNVCRGYWHDEDATRALIDADGWLHSGDLGTFDGHGYLCITGRKKDLIITAYGKNISPEDLETDLANHPLVDQAVVIGDGRRFLTALLALDGAAVENWARTKGKGAVGLESLAHDPDLRGELTEAVDAVNQRHARVEHIRRWRVLPRPLMVASGELTPTLKVKRPIVNDRYRELIEEMYAEPASQQERSID
jgi:long-chain acyl-CoA synthetase